MEYCKKCIFYDEGYDEMMQSGDDVYIEGSNEEEKHYCRMYQGPINSKITQGKKLCQYRIAD